MIGDYSVLGIMPNGEGARIVSRASRLWRDYTPGHNTKGLLMRSVLISVASVVMLSSVLLSQATKPATHADATAAMNLKKLSLSLIGYAQQNRGFLPPDLGTLVAARNANAELLISPSRVRDVAMPKDLDAQAIASWVSKNSDFVYLCPPSTRLLPGGEPASVPIVCEKYFPGQATMSVLFLDMHVVEFVPKSPRPIAE